MDTHTPITLIVFANSAYIFALDVRTHCPGTKTGTFATAVVQR